MSLSVPTTQEVTETIVAQLEAALSQTIPLLPKSFTRVLAKALGGVFVLIYKYAGFVFLQLFVAYATMRETTINGVVIRPLVEWGRLIGVGDPDDATRAELLIDVTVTDQTGDLAGGSHLLRSQTGVGYQTITTVPLDAATVQVTIRATSDQQGNGGEGVIGNLEPGDEVSFVNPLPNIVRVAVVDSQTVQAADAESEENYRRRVMERFQAKPQGGAYADYRVWATSVEGIIRAYPYTGQDPGEVDVFCEATEASSGSPDGIPTGAQLTAIYDAIQLDEAGTATRRPVGAAVNVYAITRTAFDVDVDGLDVSSATETEATVKSQLDAAVDEYLRGREPFIVGLSVLPRLDRITEAGVSGVVDAVLDATGAVATSVTVEKGGTPLIAYTLDDGEKAKLGVISYG